jgi:hypothetical protein
VRLPSATEAGFNEQARQVFAAIEQYKRKLVRR